MVKNLPSVERSTKIRFGKHVPDSNDQEENTIVFNASNVTVPTPYSNAVYLSPIRNRTDYTAPEIVLLMYDRNTKEITESGESANALIGGVTLEIATNRGNTTSNVVQFISSPESFVTSGNVGIANTLASHTVSVGSNLYIDEFGSNVLVVSGNVAILRDMVVEGNLQVNGDTTVIYTENTSIKDALIELGKDNTSGDTTLDLGVLMHRPDALSNVVVGYREGTDEFAIAYTDAKPTDKTFTPKTDEDLNVKVYGNTYVTGNVEVTKSLIVSGNTHLEGDNVFITHTMDFLDPTTAIVTDQVSNVQIRLGQLENVAKTVSNPSEDHTIVYDGTEWVNDYPMHTYIKIRNDEDTATIEKGDAVYVKGTHNSNILNVGLAQSDSATTMPCIGLSNQRLTAGQQGTAIAYGKALSVATGDFEEGETLYVSNTVPGGLSNLKPYNNDLIQNVGVVTKVHGSNGGVFVTGIGRANDIPNAELITDYNEMNYVYVNDTNNDLKKITSANLNIPLTTAVSSSSNSAANAVTLRGVSITSGDGFHGDLTVAGNVTVDSTTFHVDAETSNVGIGKTNPEFTLDVDGDINFSGKFYEDGVEFISSPWTIETVPDALSYTAGNVGIGIANPDSTLQVSGNTYISSNLQVGEVANLYVDTETSNVGIGKTNPGFTLDVDGDINFSGKFYEDGVEFISSPWTIQTVPDALSYTAGNVGIGTASPLAGSNLHVFGSTTTISIDTAGSAAGPEFSLYRDQTGSNGNYLGQIRFDGKHGGGNDQLFGKITGKIKNATQGSEDGIIETALVTDGSQRISVRHSGDLFHVKNGTDFEVGEVANLYVDTATSRVGINTDSPGYSLDVRGTSNVGVFTTPDATVTDSTAATSTSTGALKVTGGAGIQGDLYANDGHFTADVSVGSLSNKYIPYANASKILTDSQLRQETDGTMVIASDLEISGNLLVQGNTSIVSANNLVVSDRIIDIANNNPEHDLDIGILMEHPGHNIGIIHHPEDYLSIGYTSNGYGDTHILRDYSNEFTVNVWGYVTTQNTITIVHNDLHVESGKIGVNTTDPAADIYVSGNTYISSNLQVGEVANLYVDTETSNVGIGKTNPGFTLDVDGDINFSGKFYESGVEFVSSPWTIETVPDALSYTAGNIGIGAANPVSTLHVTGNTYVSSNLQVGEVANLYVDTETSNVGIGKTNPGFSLDVVGDINFSGSLYEDGAAFVSTPWTIDGDDLEYTAGNIGIGTNAAAATLHVGGNIYSSSNISAYEIEVANVTTTNLIMNTVTVSAGELSLDNTVIVSNITSNTLQFTNSNVGVVATGNVVANYFKGDGSQLTGIAPTLQSVSDFGNTSSNVIQFTNADVGVVATGNVVANYFKGDGSKLTGIATTLQSVSDFGNTSSNVIQFTNATTGFVTTSNVIVGGIAKQSSVPAFTVRLTDGSVTGAGVIDYNQVDTDNTSSYTTSDGRFTAPVAGHYFFSAHGIWQNDETIYDFTINGTRQNINSLCNSPAANYLQCNISAVLDLSVGDYVSVYQVEGGTFGTDNNVFTGFFIG